MRHAFIIPVLAACGAALGGCVGTNDAPLGLAATPQAAPAAQPRVAASVAAATQPGPQPLPAPPPGAKWEMPWQLSLSSPASVAQGEKTYVSLVPGYGPVRGTTQALTYLNYPLDTIRTRPGRNLAVTPCRGVVEKEAKSHGAVRVEAASAGPGRRTRSGYEGPVALRILYPRDGGLEVRQSILECKLDRAMTVRDAVVADPAAPRYASLPAR